MKFEILSHMQLFFWIHRLNACVTSLAKPNIIPECMVIKLQSHESVPKTPIC